MSGERDRGDDVNRSLPPTLKEDRSLSLRSLRSFVANVLFGLAAKERTEHEGNRSNLRRDLDQFRPSAFTGFFSLRSLRSLAANGSAGLAAKERREHEGDNSHLSCDMEAF